MYPNYLMIPCKKKKNINLTHVTFIKGTMTVILNIIYKYKSNPRLFINAEVGRKTDK